MPLFSNEKIEEFIYHKELLSTNAHAIGQVNKQESNTNVVYYTFKQSEGRGQIGKSWYSGSGKNLAFSLSMPLKACYVSWGSYLNLWVANTIRSFIQIKLPNHKIEVKWPNYIYVGKTKICGLLIQCVVQAKFIKHIVIGVGINVNEDQFPKDLPNPSSIRLASQKEYQLIPLLQELIEHIELQIPSFSFSNFEEILALYHKHLYLKDHKHRFIDAKKNQKFEAIIRSVDGSGAIHLETANGIRAYKFREIQYE